MGHYKRSRVLVQTQFWQHMMRRTVVRLLMTTACYPQGDGQTNSINSILNIYIRAFGKRDQQRWPTLIPFVELCYNTTMSRRTEKNTIQLVLWARGRIDERLIHWSK